VLISDEVAEHIPGCNMAFRRDRLLDIGGFDAQFRVAGDDVDVCWRLQARGWTLGFSPAAMVWHHRRNSISRFLKQQRGYAKAEALLARKWPEKYNSAGHMLWHGRLYGRGVMESVFQQSRIYHGSWGVALFQSVYQPSAGLFSSLPLMPEWYFLVAALGVVGALGVVWPPLYAVLALFVLAFACTLLQAIRGGMRADIQPRPAGVSERWRMKAIVAYLHLMQPGARLLGRIEHGLGPWAPRWKALGRAVPRPTSVALWSERWEALESRLAALERVLHDEGVAALRGGDFSRWDLDVRGGALGSVRSLAMVEEHGAGRQMIRLRAWPRIPGVTVGAAGLLTALAVAAGLNGSPVAAAGLGAGALVLAVAAYADAAAAMAAWRSAVRRLAKDAALMPR
jgi:hypothetical protein